MNHSIEFGRSSWAGTDWKTSPGRLSTTTWMTSAPPSSSYSAASQGEPSANDTVSQEFDKKNFKIFTKNQQSIFLGPSAWVTTNQRTYKSEPVMARARLALVSSKRVGEPD